MTGRPWAGRAISTVLLLAVAALLVAQALELRDLRAQTGGLAAAVRARAGGLAALATVLAATAAALAVAWAPMLEVVR